MNTRIQKAFSNEQKPIVAYVSVGAPDLQKSTDYILNLIDAGVGVIELGVPFSDPTADGAVIQKAGSLALSLGVGLDEILGVAKTIRKKHPQIPIILFSYFNVLLQYGLSKIKDMDIDGLLIVDLPLEEREEILPFLKGTDIDWIPLISPLTDQDRSQKILQGCEGFVYYIAVQGVTGVRSSLSSDITAKLQQLKSLTSLPVVAGFGISKPEMAKEVLKYADGVVMGSALVQPLLDAQPEKGLDLIRQIIKALK